MHPLILPGCMNFCNDVRTTLLPGQSYCQRKWDENAYDPRLVSCELYEYPQINSNDAIYHFRCGVHPGSDAVTLRGAGGAGYIHERSINKSLEGLDENTTMYPRVPVSDRRSRADVRTGLDCECAGSLGSDLGFGTAATARAWRWWPWPGACSAGECSRACGSRSAASEPIHGQL